MFLWIPGRLPGLNELVEARMVRGRQRSASGKTWSQYSDIKRDCEERIVLAARSQRFKPVHKHFSYLFVEENKRRDPSNISAGAVKMIEDGLQKAGLISNDGWAQIEGDTRYFHISSVPGVFLMVRECPVLSQSVMVAKLQQYLLGGCKNG